MPNVIIVAYKTRLIDPCPYPAEVENAGDKKAVQAERERFISLGRNTPFTSTFDEVMVADMAPNKAAQWKWHPGDGSLAKSTVAVRVRNFFLKYHPRAWTDDVDDRPLFVGFGINYFLTLLGIECSLPSSDRPCPPSLWYSPWHDNRNFVDLTEALRPTEVNVVLPLDYLLQFWTPIEPEAKKKWTDSIKGWKEPGVDLFKDMVIATELAHRLGFIPRVQVPIPI